MASSNDVEHTQDPSYKYFEPDIEKLERPLAYKPKYFLRAHSKKNDPADVQTQIWQCLFEPDPVNLNGNTNIVATCGGTSVCFIDVTSGEVLLKHDNSTKTLGNENLYSLAWSSIPLDDLGLRRINIAAVGGARSTVLLMHPEQNICYSKFKTVSHKHNMSVCSLLFYPKKANWLFCGHEDGNIQLWDVGIPNEPDYDVVPAHLMTIPPVAGDVFNMSFSHKSDLLIAGCDQGLFAWHVDIDRINKGHRLHRTEFILPQNESETHVVDSITLVRDDILAFKCVLSGCIYVFNIVDAYSKATMNKQTGQREVDVEEDSMLALKWSDTDNYFMNMGVDSKSGLLVCGDDKGCLWLYDLHDHLKNIKKIFEKNLKSKEGISHDLLLHWPDLKDPEVEKARKLKLDTYDIVVDKCCVSSNGDFIVAVTSNNMVCIWEKE